MSNHLAIATVSETLCKFFETELDELYPGLDAVPVRPKEPKANDNSPRIHVFLYQVTENPALKNSDIPTRQQSGNVITRPQIALDLNYLFSFYGDESKLEPQRLLGSVASLLHSRCVLTRKMIETAIQAADDYLKTSDLAEQVEKVKFTPLPQSLEELSKLWSVFFQTPYTLSVAYQASVVLIESKEVPSSPLPVRDRYVYVSTIRRPYIEKITSEYPNSEPKWAMPPILVGYTLVLSGWELKNKVTMLRINNVDIELTDEEVTESVIKIPLTSGRMSTALPRAGVASVQIIQPVEMGEPATSHQGFESNLAAFVIQPRVKNVEYNDPDGGDNKKVIVSFDPKVGKTQKVTLSLNQINVTPGNITHNYRLNAPQNNGISDESSQETETIAFDVKEDEKQLVEAGDYLVRVKVDNADSPLEADEAGNYIGPKVVIT